MPRCRSTLNIFITYVGFGTWRRLFFHSLGSAWHLKATVLFPVHPTGHAQATLHVRRTPRVPLRRLYSCEQRRDLIKSELQGPIILDFLYLYMHLYLGITISWFFRGVIIVTRVIQVCHLKSILKTFKYWTCNSEAYYLSPFTICYWLSQC